MLDTITTSIEERAFLSKVKLYDTSSYVQHLERAIQFTKNAHKGQHRASGEEYFHHPLEVANILASMKLDSLTLIVALLHDTVEDTPIILKTIEEEFGAKVAELVDGITKLNLLDTKSDAVVQAENFRKLIVATSKDIRVLLVKLADRLHNMRTLSFLSCPKKQNRIALETLEVFAPLAERIGVQTIKNELQDLSFSYIYPDIRQSMIKRLEMLRKDGATLTSGIIQELDDLLTLHGIKAKISGREKSSYSIWMKMKKKNIDFEQLTDVVAFRIIVTDLLDCYKALGLIHQKYHAVPGEIEDYISTPKQNGYQSLHTIIMGPFDHKIEVQIRSAEMHKIAELGIAAHWFYKQGSGALEAKENTVSYGWVKELLDTLESSSDATEVLENSKLDIYDDQVFCFTPRGQVIALPKDACPIDFAYAIHSDMGNHCVGARVNKRIVPLKTKLKNGDQVEIVIDKSHKPLPSWEKFAVTQKALTEIRRIIRQEKHAEYVNLGKMILSQALKAEGVQYAEDTLASSVKFFNKDSLDALLATIGEGQIFATEVLEQIKSQKVKKTRISLRNDSRVRPTHRAQTEKKISIKGAIPGVAVHFAQCCHPIPGDRIVGIHQTLKGIMVHISDCETLHNYSSTPERWLDVAWDKNPTKPMFTAAINVTILNQVGGFAEITSEVAAHKINIKNLRITTRTTDFFEIMLDLDVKGLYELSNLIAALRTKPLIHLVQRHIKQ